MTKPVPDLTIRFPGSVRPEAIPMTMLARVLSAVQQLALGQDVPEEEDRASAPTVEQPKAIRILDVIRSSATFRAVAPNAEAVRHNLKLAGDFIDNPEGAPEGYLPVRAVEELSTISRVLRCPIIVTGADYEEDILARIEPDSYTRVSKSLFVTGRTNLVGNVQRAGGATEWRCAIRVRSQAKLVYCRVKTPELVQDLGQWLYRDVTVYGTATWVRPGMTIVDFLIDAAEEPKTGSIIEALDAAWAAGGDAWDDIDDPERFLSEVTGDR